ncbi:MAG: ABC transporter permease [Candidatus Tectomicrobia bacterium]|uniref:ABC transporter permease n=1 Tax=Tectimicrobiota bacterium TaxID=2528274 RepID=A0A932CM88_UNCTE|nr:ABC transporter permease [Candidatus Tectomicrobia bacterium]
MSLLINLRIALRALGLNRLRSFLTALGIIIGVSSVIVMLALGSGAKARIAEEIASAGSNLLIVLSGSTTSGGLRMGMGSTPTLTAADAQAIQRECPAVKFAAPSIRGPGQVVYRHQNWSTLIYGTTPEMLEIRDWPLSSGRPFTASEVEGSAKVCLLGEAVVEKLFGDADPLGQTIRIKKVPFKVIGILAPKGQSFTGQDQDDTIYLPLTTAQKRIFGQLFQGMVSTIMVEAWDTDSLAAAEEQVNQLLRQRHHIQPGQEDDFGVRNLTEMMGTAQETARVMSLLLGAIASVSLIVGGIGIMNIMLVSVTERTREIGIRMAVGAREQDVLLQFLIEALTLSALGGMLGIGLGMGASRLAGRLTGWPTAIGPQAVLLAFGFAVAVGLFFGYYPARKASHLNPIEALRYE